MTILGILASGISGNLEPVNPVTANIYAWFDASRAGDFTYSSGTSVSQWNDRSGNGRHLSQATAANQPSRSGTMNGRSTVIFDNTNDFLDFGSNQDLGADYTVFAVLDTPLFNTTSNGAFLLYTGGINGGLIGLGETTGGLTNERLYWLRLTNARGYGETSSDISDGDHQFTWRLDNKTTVQYRIDKTTKTLTTSSQGAFTSTEWAQYFRYLSYDTNPLNSEVAELIIYNASLSDADRDSVENYLSDKWGL